MSEQTLQEASRRLEQANGPTLYAIGLLGSGMQRSGRDALQDLAGGTGGVAYFPESLDQVDNITRTVAHDIRSQYRIAYKPKNQNVKPEFQEVHVEAHAPGYGKLTVRTRSGYYPPESSHWSGLRRARELEPASEIAGSVAMPPAPVFLLFFGRQRAEVAIGIPVVFRCPLIVVNNFVVIPSVVVAVLGVINPFVMARAARSDYRTRQHSG
jgi:hypothetical protein